MRENGATIEDGNLYKDFFSSQAALYQYVKSRNEKFVNHDLEKHKNAQHHLEREFIKDHVFQIKTYKVKYKSKMNSSQQIVRNRKELSKMFFKSADYNHLAKKSI